MKLLQESLIVWERGQGNLPFLLLTPGTATKAREVYKCNIFENNIIASICHEFPDELLKEVVTMSMAMMTPPDKKC